jgi:hypothetical protein
VVKLLDRLPATEHNGWCPANVAHRGFSAGLGFPGSSAACDARRTLPHNDSSAISAPAARYHLSEAGISAVFASRAERPSS